MSETAATYLGDGVYASCDGWHIWLRTSRESGVHEIALEPPVIDALIEYVKSINAKGTPS
jgi:hypothetical protein